MVTKTKWPCVFRGKFIRDQVDPRVAREWKETYGENAPFGELRRLWRTEHCRELNPYGSDTCAYAEEQCALAFYIATERVTSRRLSSPKGYFKKFVRTFAGVRADEKPLRRDREETTIRTETSSMERLGGLLDRFKHG